MLICLQVQGIQIFWKMVQIKSLSTWKCVNCPSLKDQENVQLEWQAIKYKGLLWTAHQLIGHYIPQYRLLHFCNRTALGFVSVKRVTKRNTGVISLNTRSRLTLRGGGGGGNKTLGYAKSGGYPKCGILRSGDIQNNGNFDKEDNQNILILNCKA